MGVDARAGTARCLGLFPHRSSAMGDSTVSEYDTIPLPSRDALIMHILYGIEPGGFIDAVLCNDFMYAVQKADGENIKLLRVYANFLYNYAPHACYGTVKDVEHWRDRRTEEPLLASQAEWPTAEWSKAAQAISDSFYDSRRKK